MLKQFYPDERAESTYQIPFEAFYQKGIRGVIFDVDNTLVPHDAPADDQARQLFKRLRTMGMESCLASNNKEPRVRQFAEDVGTRYIFKAGKPKRKGYREAMEKMGIRPEETMVVGDQIFTDIWGANRTGLYSILVDPINPKEEIKIVLKRIPEKLILYAYERKKK